MVIKKINEKLYFSDKSSAFSKKVVQMKFLYLLFIFFILSCTPSLKQSNSEVKTNLGVRGNQELADIFSSYKEKSKHCKSATSGQIPIIITGFGMYHGNYNISGVLSELLGSENTSHLSQQEITQSMGRTSFEDFGGRVFQKVITIKNKHYNICSMVLDVKWDLAAAIIIHEINLFKPKAVLMMGQEEALSIEKGALNITGHKMPGVDSDGNAVGFNNPHSEWILDPNLHNKLPHKVLHSWNGEKIKNALNEIQIDLNYPIILQKDANQYNDYVCNNTAYIVQFAANSGSTIKLAGDKIQTQINNIARRIQIGFLHLPWKAMSTEKDETKIWVESIQSVMSEMSSEN